MKKYLTFNHRVVFYTPSTRKGIKTTEQEFKKRIDQVASYFTGLFGGATLEQAKGYWKDSTGHYIVEDITKVVSFTDDKTLNKNLQAVLNFTKEKQKEFDQEAISLEIDNQFLLID
jgi:hypothetical protein